MGGNLGAPISRRTLLATAAASPFLGAAAHKPQTGWSVDRAIRPGDDFYGFVNGPWVRSAVIPSNRQDWSEFARLEDVVGERTRAILDMAARAPTPRTRAFGELYASLLDRAAIERAGLGPIATTLASAAAIATPADLARALGGIARTLPVDPFDQIAPSAPVPISPVVFLDTQRPTRYLPHLVQGGLGLPDRDYYLVDKPAFVTARAAYATFLARLFAAAGLDDADKRAGRLIALEARLAAAQRPRFELFAFDKRHNPRTQAALAAEAPGFDWAAYLDVVGYGGAATVILADPAAATAFAALARDGDLGDWRDYVRARLLAGFALAGPRPLRDALFDFRERALKGVTEPLPEWRQAAQLVDLSMGTAIGAAYERAWLPTGARRTIEAMAARITAAMRARIEGAPWMAPTTKAEALRKLDGLRIEVGGPAVVPDLAGIVTGRGDAWANLRAASEFAYRQTLAKLDGPADRGAWDMRAHSVNGMSNPLFNKIMFSAGMLQPPLYDPTGDAAANYGALGAFIAHEVSHIFDNVGSRFDADGRMRDWWSKEDRARFDAAAVKLVTQVSAIEIAPALKANGRQLLHENIADLGGVLLAHDAYRASLGGRVPPIVDGWTGDQRFFLSWARMWRATMRQAAIVTKAAIGTHAMGAIRADTVRNVDAWYAAFAVKPTDGLYLAPGDRVRIW